MFRTAITRTPGPNCASGLTTATGRADPELLLEQHRCYVTTLREFGLRVEELPTEPDYPDAYFVEDVAVVTPQIAVITRPGAPARRGEATSIAPALTPFRTLHHIAAPGTLDGGDVLLVGKRCFIGLSARTNLTGATQLAELLAPAGYDSVNIELAGGLHLKSDVNFAGGNRVLITPALADHPAFADFDRIVLDPDETYAANALWINDRLLIPAGFPKTRAALAQTGNTVVELDVSEIRKMDGGLTCMSLRF